MAGFCGKNSTTVRFVGGLLFFHRMSATTSSKRPRSDAALTRSLQKGQQTKAAIVDAALGLATQIGLEGLSIGALVVLVDILLANLQCLASLRDELYFPWRVGKGHTSQL